MVEGIGVEVLCPGCGYDMRGAGVEAGGRRCAECGKVWSGGIVSSRIPWVHRGRRGWVRSYLATIWMVLVHPMKLGREARERRVGKREARSFARVSFWVAMAVGMAEVGAWYWFVVRGNTDYVQLPHVEEGWGWVVYPMFAATDARVWWVVMGIWLWLTLRAIGWMFCWMVGWMAGKREARRRVGRLGWYAWGVLPVETVLIGGMMAAVVVSSNSAVRLAGWGEVVGEMSEAFAISAWVVAAWVGVMMVVGTRRRAALRGIVMAVVFPAMASAAAVGLMVLVMWLVGWAAVMAASMAG